MYSKLNYQDFKLMYDLDKQLNASTTPTLEFDLFMRFWQENKITDEYIDYMFHRALDNIYKVKQSSTVLRKLFQNYPKYTIGRCAYCINRGYGLCGSPSNTKNLCKYHESRHKALHTYSSLPTVIIQIIEGYFRFF